MDQGVARIGASSGTVMGSVNIPGARIADKRRAGWTHRGRGSKSRGRSSPAPLITIRRPGSFKVKRTNDLSHEKPSLFSVSPCLSVISSETTTEPRAMWIGEEPQRLPRTRANTTVPHEPSAAFTTA